MAFKDIFSAFGLGSFSASTGPTKIVPQGAAVAAPKGGDSALLKQTSRLGRTSELVGEITPADVASAISAADSGDLGPLQGLYLRMPASDARIKGHLTALQSGLLANPLRVFPSKSGTPASTEYAQIASDMLYMMKSSDVIRRMAMPYLTGVRVYEALYTDAKGRDGKTRILPYELSVVPPTLYKMDMEKDSETYGEIKIKTEDDQDGIPVSEFPWGRLIVGTDGSEQGWYDMGGAYRPCLFWYLVKNKNSQWWAELNENYGEPQRIGYFDEAANEEDLFALEQHLKNVGRAAWALFPNDIDLELLENKLSGTVKTYDDLIELANREIAIAILGVTQTSDGGNQGSYAKANIHMSIQYQVLSAIALMIKEQLDDLVAATIAFNVGPNFDPADLPEIRLVVPNPEQKEVKARVLKLAQELGLPIGAQHVRDELGIPEPDEEDEILEPAWMQVQNSGDDQEGEEDEENPDEPDEPGEKDDTAKKRNYDKEDDNRKTERD